MRDNHETKSGGKNMGKKRKKPQKNQKENTNDEITINTDAILKQGRKITKKAQEYTKNKYIKAAWILILIIALITITAYVRLGPANLPITEEWAKSTIESNVKSALEQQIRAGQPNLPDASVQRLINEQYAEYYNANKDEIETEKTRLTNQYKAQLQNDNGMTYLLGIDEYFFYSMAKWYQKNGYFGTEVIDGEEKFMLRNGRFGEASTFRTHPYLINVLHDAWKPFNSNFNIEWASFYIQVVLMALGAIPLFFLAKRFSGTTGGFIATALVLTAVPLVGRTLGGSSDDDAHTMIFTFTMMALLFTALGRDIKTTAILAGLAGLVNSIFMITWSGWWYGYLLVLGSAGLYIIYTYASKKIEGKQLSKKDWIKNSTFFAVFLVSAVIFSMIISAPLKGGNSLDMAESVIIAPKNPIELILRLESGADRGQITEENYALWPNVLRTVAELNPATFNQIISGAGSLPLGGAGLMFFYISVLGIITLFLRYREDTKYPFYGLVLLIWMAGMIFVAQSAVRFILMASIPILLGVGAFIGAIIGPVAKYVAKEGKISKDILVGTLSVLLVLWFLWVPIGNAKAVGDNAIPIFDDAWYESMDAIREDAGNTRGIISSWWDYGHFFQAYGNQTVTFDGADQGKRIYWMGQTLLTDNPDEAHNILKVMNCGQEEPYDLLDENMDRYKATKINLEIAQMSRSDAEEYMRTEDISEDLIQEVLSLTHCEDYMPMYFVTSEDMVGKAGVWGHFGGWNFTKAYFYYNLKNLPLPDAQRIANENLDMSDDEIRRLYNEARLIRTEDDAASWISPFPSYMTRQKTTCAEQNETITCNFNAAIQQDATATVVLRRATIPLNNQENTEITLQILDRRTNMPIEQRTLKPNALVIERDGEFEERQYDDADLGFDLVIMDENGSYNALLTDPSLSKSIFTRLFFMEGRGEDLEMFERISDVTSFRGERIIVWKVTP